MLFPDYFTGRAKKWRDFAKKMRNSKLAQTFGDGARVLTRIAIEAKRSWGRANGREEQPPTRIVSSKAKTLGRLRRELQNLSDGMSLHLLMRDYVYMFSWSDQMNDAWRASGRLGEEFGCHAELRPDGRIWFVKRN